MFKNSAGTDFVDQIKFMADQGFRSVEDNGMLGRSVAEQEKNRENSFSIGNDHGSFCSGWWRQLENIFDHLESRSLKTPF